MKRLIWALAMLTLTATLGSAQSLAEVAKKEKERRKKVDGQEKNSFTENDLRGGPRLPATPPAPAAGPASTGGESASAAAAPAEEEPAADPTMTESYWRERVSAANKRIQDLEARLQSPELNADMRGASRRQAAERDLAQAKSEKQAILDEARKKRVPPGWLR
ncbi:MAG TPA: hypothetical protein VIG29_14550 [Vicinamibacteria bacterium]